MKLGVIGSGNIGKGIGSWAAKVGYDVTFSSKDEAGARAAAPIVDADSHTTPGSDICQRWKETKC
jgi:predicted dinucleotide-binding enzyme